MVDGVFLTCVYCGNPNIHPERLYRYCTSDACVKSGQEMMPPKYHTTTVTDNTAEVLCINSDLAKTLSDALLVIEQQKQDLRQCEKSISEGFENAYKVYDNSVSVARFDCYRAMVDSHKEYVWAESLANHDDEYVRGTYRQMRSTLEHGMHDVGIRTYGTLGEVVSLDPDNTEYNHARYECQSSGGTVISLGYETTTGLVIKQALVQ